MLSLSEQTSDISHLRELKERGIPLILFDRITDQMEVTKVTTDNETGGKRATTHLIERGCRRIAFLGISRTLSVSTGRMHDVFRSDRIELKGYKFPDQRVFFINLREIQCCSNKEVIPESIFQG